MGRAGIWGCDPLKGQDAGGERGGTEAGPVGSSGGSLGSGVRSGSGQRDAMALVQLMVHGGAVPGEEWGLRALRGHPQPPPGPARSGARGRLLDTQVWPVHGTEDPPFPLAEAGQDGGSRPGGRAEGEEGPMTVGASLGGFQEEVRLPPQEGLVLARPLGAQGQSTPWPASRGWLPLAEAPAWANVGGGLGCQLRSGAHPSLLP